MATYVFASAHTGTSWVVHYLYMPCFAHPSVRHHATPNDGERIDDKDAALGNRRVRQSEAGLALQLSLPESSNP